MAEGTSTDDITFDTKQENVLSKVISAQLSLNGKTEREGRIVHSCVTLDERLLAEAFKESVYFGGSFGEATFQRGSDMDMMMVAPDISVTYSNDFESPDDGFGHVFLALRDKDSPVYIKLQPIKVEKEDPDVQKFLHTDAEGEIFASSDKYVEYVVSVWKSKRKRDGNKHFEEYFRNGPCASRLSIAKDGSWESSVDMAYAIRCRSWPSDADEWFARPRHNGWPSEYVLQKIRKLETHVVATGDPLSPSASLCWRISFLLAERELVRNFNEMQLKCFSLLKTILHNQISIKFPDSLSTYHMKTTLFWIIEQKPQTIWTPDNLLYCVRVCLNRIAICVRFKKLPHYILPQQNLFNHKLTDIKERLDLFEELLELASNPTISILKHAKIGGLYDILEQYGVDLLLQICGQSMDEINVQDSVQKEQSQLTVLYSFRIFQRILDLPLEGVLSTELNHNDDLDEEFKLRVQMFLHLKAGLDKQRVASGSDETSRISSMEEARKELEQGLKADALTGRLYLANYHIMNCDFETAKTTLISMLSQNVGVVYFGNCSEYKFLSIEAVLKVAIQKSVPSKSGTQPKSACNDILFRKVDVHSVPHAVCFEIALSEDMVTIYPLVYAYFLFVVAYHHLGLTNDRKAAIDDLETGVKLTQRGSDHHIALNLLAHAHLMAGNRKDAMANFIQSATLCPSYKNAALYNIAILLLQEKVTVLYTRS